MIRKGILLLTFVFPLAASESVVNRDYVDHYARVRESVVTVYTNDVFDELYGIGTGFVYKEDAEHYYIMTNAHVVEGGFHFDVSFRPYQLFDVTLVAASFLADIAVLKLDKSLINWTVPILEMGNSDYVKPGEEIFAVGNPYSYDLDGTFTKGLVSQTKKFLCRGDYGNCMGIDIQPEVAAPLIHIDSVINSGNSGGPLFNIFGQVIGVNSYKYHGSYHLSFSIEINYALDIAHKLETNQRVVYTTLGRTLIELPIASLFIEFSENVTHGVLVYDSPSHTELPSGSVVTKIGDTEIYSLYDYHQAIYYGTETMYRVEYIFDGAVYNKPVFAQKVIDLGGAVL